MKTKPALMGSLSQIAAQLSYAAWSLTPEQRKLMTFERTGTMKRGKSKARTGATARWAKIKKG